MRTYVIKRNEPITLQSPSAIVINQQYLDDAT